LTVLAGMSPQQITNDNYIQVRNNFHRTLDQSKIASSVYDLTSLLSFVSIVGYPKIDI